MQFKVPQFIDVEDKVFGPFTFRQFVYLAGGAGLSYLSIRFLPGFIAFFAVPVFAGFALALAFFKYNDKPFINTVEAFLRYTFRSKTYLWRKDNSLKTPAENIITKNTALERNAFTENRLQTLSRSLDIIDPKN